MLNQSQIKELVGLENVNPEFQNLVQKCAIISSFNEIYYEDLVDVLFRKFFECFYSSAKDVYFLLRVGDENQTLYTYKMIFDKCMHNAH